MAGTVPESGIWSSPTGGTTSAASRLPAWALPMGLTAWWGAWLSRKTARRGAEPDFLSRKVPLKDLSAVLDAVVSAYEVDRDTAQVDLLAFVGQMVEAGLLIAV